MFKTTSVSGLRFVSMLVACICGGAALAENEPATIIVTPARARVVQLVQDMFRLRQLHVVSYRGEADTAEPVLHKWDGRTWKRIAVEECLATLPERVVLIGDRKTLPAVLIDAAARRENVRNIQTLDVTTLIGEFSKMFALSPSEITPLASRNGVTVVDRNEDLIRYGRYYPGPGYDKLHGKSPQSPGKTEIPPEPELAPVKIEPASPEKPAPAEKEPAPAIPAPEKTKASVTPDDK